MLISLLPGGGKSTIAHLIEQFYYPSSGAIYLDDIDLRDIDPAFLHRYSSLLLIL